MVKYIQVEEALNSIYGVGDRDSMLVTTWTLWTIKSPNIRRVERISLKKLKHADGKEFLSVMYSFNGWTKELEEEKAQRDPVF